MEELEQAKVIVRRKAKRIQRAFDKMSELERDIRRSNGISLEEKKVLLSQTKEVMLYLINDDKEENKYNYDNANN